MSGSKPFAILALILAPLLLLVGLLVILAVDEDEQAALTNCDPTVGDGSVRPAVYVDPQSVPAGPVAGYSGDQLVNAAYIMAAAQALDLSLRDQQIGVMTAMGESGLRALDQGYAAGPDSRGLFQQRGNGAWGSYADRMDPFTSATSFFTVLATIANRDSLEPTAAAHQVQRNADPNYYTPFWSPAVEVVAALADTAAEPAVAAAVADAAAVGGAGPVTASTAVDYNLGAVKPQLTALVGVLAPMFNITTVGGYRVSAIDPGGHPAGLAADFMTSSSTQGDQLAAYARAHAAELDIDYVIWRQQIWSVARSAEGWRAMEDRGGATENHFDHVHINVNPGGTSVAADVAAASADCAFPTASFGGVVFPLAAEFKDSDQHNWHESGGLWSSWHSGTDFSVPCGTPVLASHAGTVSIDTTQSWAGPQLVKVSTGATSLTTWYAHMQTVSVASGDVVAAGDQIGQVGDQGNATGCHLHFEVHLENGSIYGSDNVDPSAWLKDNVGKMLDGGSIAAVRVASFNALGGSHTDNGRGEKPDWPDSPARTQATVGYFGRYAPDVIGLQEFQTNQARILLSQLGKTYGYVAARDNAVMWRRDKFTLVSDTTISVPYFGGNLRKMPVVRLQQLATGAIITVISVHNPASVHGPADSYRRAAVAAERALVEQETAAGRTVFLVGDFNEREPAFCTLTRGGLMVASNGGSNAAGGCASPANDRIDWIFATPNVGFSDYVADQSTGRQRVSDHPWVQAVAQPAV